MLERIRKLEARKVIRGYTAEVDPVAIGQGMLAFVAVRSEEGPADDSVALQLASFPRFSKSITSPAKTVIWSRSGPEDAEQLGVLLRTRIGRIPGVRSTRTTIVLETVKETSRLTISARRTEAPA